MKEKYGDLLLACKERKYLKIQRKSLAVKTYLINDYTAAEVANIFEVTERTIFNWVNQYQNEGIAGLEDQPGRGRKKYVSDEEFREILEREEITTPLQVQKIIHEEYDIEYHLDTIRYRMRKLGWSIKSNETTYSHRAKPKEIRKTQKEHLEEISRLEEEGWTLFAMDQAIFTLATTKGPKFWSKKGTRIYTPTKYSRDKVVVFGAIAENNEHFFQLFDRTTNETMMEFIDSFSKEFDKAIWLLDHASWHTSETVQKYAEKKGIKLLFLPKAVPEINAIEQHWNTTKREIKTGVYYETVEEMENAILKHLRKTPHGLDIKKYFKKKIKI